MADIHCLLKQIRTYETNRGVMYIPVFTISQAFDNNSNFWLLDPPYGITLIAAYDIATNCLPLSGNGFAFTVSGSTLYYNYNTGGAAVFSGSTNMPRAQYRNLTVGMALVEDINGEHIILPPMGGFTYTDMGVGVGITPTQTEVGFCTVTTGANIRMWSATADATHKAVGAYIYGKSEEIPTDPYSGAGDSDTGGGDGTFDGSSDPVPIPSLPTVGATDSGFITLFAPTISQLKALAYYMWVNPLFDIETGFKKIFSDPMDCILGLSVVPVTVPTGGAQNVTVGNLVTSVTMNVASQQYIEINCGSIDFTARYFGSYLDFEPYTKMSLFVPYSGVHAVNADDIMGKVVTLKYHIDILTGSLVAFLLCGDSVLYEFNGACASNIPVNSINYASTIENAIRIAVNIGTTVATAGAAAPATTAATTAAAANTARNIATGINLAGSTAEGALSMKPGIDRAGSLGGTTGLMGNQTPYFIITRPRLCKPAKQNELKGYPSFITYVVGDLEGQGYTEFDTIVLSGLYLTDAEKDELIGILKGGVYL